MSCTPEAAAQLQQVVADLVRIAELDLPPLEKLSLLCVQIGTAQHLLDELQRPVASGHDLGGPHFVAQPQRSPIPRSGSSQRDV